MCGRSAGTKCGFGQEAHVEHRSESTGMPCLKPKLRMVTTSCGRRAVRASTPVNAWRSSWTVMSDVSTIWSASRGCGCIALALVADAFEPIGPAPAGAAAASR